MSTLSQAKDQVGELLITGFAGPELSPKTTEFLKSARIGGVIYFAHNYESPAQIAELSHQVQSCRDDLPLWIGVDHEGGRVQRFKKGFTRIPEAMAMGGSESPKLLFEVSELIAKELRAVGVNLNFAPVADIATNPKNPVIGNRAFGTDEETVSRAVTAFVRGHLTQGVQACVKHFPGHGDTSTDSHFALPKVDTRIETLMEREFKPFVKAVKSRCNFLMTAHVVCSQIDPDHPSTLSSKVLREILRNQLRYSRIIVADDMEMKAVTDHFGAADAPRLAIQAGCDLLPFRSETAARAAYEALMSDLEAGRLAPELVLESVARLRDLKKSELPSYTPIDIAGVGKIVGIPEHQELVARLVPPVSA